ncbi:MAG TPA: VWA domain-containing protein [Herpetosiphonaceae bacterium]|nr:VWA domain-containing protein [Herpetosiphonaceae bacterium]
MPEDIRLTTKWARQPLPANTAQVAYLLIEARPQAVVAASAPAVNFSMVLDRSGSMDGPKIESLKRAVMEVIDTLRPEDTISVVVFDETAEVIVPSSPVADKAALKNRVESIRVQGGTAMSTGLEAGIAEARKGVAPDRVSHLLLLTDGQTWGDEDQCRAIAQQLAAENVRITALGLGDEWNEQLLDDLADATQGTSDYVADPKDIEKYFQAATAAAQGTAVRKGRLLLRLAQGVTPRAVFRVTPMIANLGYKPIAEREVHVDLGDIQSDPGASVLVELMLPANAPGSYRVAQAELTYDVPQENRLDQRVRADAMLEFSATASGGYDPQAMNLVERVTAFKLQTRALDEAAAGNIAGATQKLRSAATRLLDLGELELANTMNRAAETMTTGGGPSAADQKQMKYATKRLTLDQLTGDAK